MPQEVEKKRETLLPEDMYLCHIILYIYLVYTYATEYII